MPTGQIKYYNSEKSFGFIAQDSGEADVFLHASAIKWATDEIRAGQRVKYDVVAGQKGLIAQNVEVLLTPIEQKRRSQGKVVIPRDYVPLQKQGGSFEVKKPVRPQGVPQPTPPPPATSRQPQESKVQSKPAASSAETGPPRPIEGPLNRQTSEIKSEPVASSAETSAPGPVKSPPPKKTAAPGASAKPKAKPKKPERPTLGDLYVQKQVRLKTPMVFGLYNHTQLPVTVSALTPYTFILEKSENEKQEFPKTDVKYCYKAEDSEKIQPLMRYNEEIKAQKLMPIIPRKERYHIDTRDVWQARKDRYPIEVMMREGEIFRGLVDWVSRYEIKLILANGAKIVVFQHAICDFKAFPSEKQEADEGEPES